MECEAHHSTTWFLWLFSPIMDILHFSSTLKWSGERACSVLSETLKNLFLTKQSLFFILATTAISRTNAMAPLIMEVHIISVFIQNLVPNFFLFFFLRSSLQKKINNNFKDVYAKRSGVSEENSELGFKLRVSNVGSPACDNNIWVIEEWVTIIFLYLFELVSRRSLWAKRRKKIRII